jgi:hypothetical protein
MGDILAPIECGRGHLALHSNYEDTMNNITHRSNVKIMMQHYLYNMVCNINIMFNDFSRGISCT